MNCFFIDIFRINFDDPSMSRAGALAKSAVRHNFL